MFDVKHCAGRCARRRKFVQMFLCAVYIFKHVGAKPGLNTMSSISFSSIQVKDKKGKEVGKTVRISVVLPEVTEDTYAEINYKEELAARKKKDKSIKNSTSNSVTKNGFDPILEDDDDDVRRIAQEMEAKYGGIAMPKKKKKGRRDDYADIGMGYDESDSFIDNTDGYDEMVPPNVTTLHGGFYINCGALEFKTDDEISDSSSDSEQEEEEQEDKKEVEKNHKPVRKKRILEFSDSEGEKETDKINHNEKKQKLESNGVPKAVKRKLSNASSDEKSKKKAEEMKVGTPSVKELLREKRIDLNMSLPESESDLTDKDELMSPKAVVKSSNPEKRAADSISHTIESVIKDTKKNSDSVKKSLINDYTSDSDKECGMNGTQEIVKLPENLPADIVELIEKIKVAASSSTEGKVKFFSGPVSTIILSLERRCKCLGRQSRIKVYEHLAPFVRCRKETLMKRAKHLVLEDDQKKLKNMINKLKNTIANVMPSLIQAYEVESLSVQQKKQLISNTESEEKKALKMPKRRFSWPEDSKKLFKDIILLCRKCFLQEGKNKDAIDSQLLNFLKIELLPLWPEGWMTLGVLQRLCNNACEVKKSSSNTSTSSSLPKTLTSNMSLSITPINNNGYEESKKEPPEVIKPKESKECKMQELTITPTSLSVNTKSPKKDDVVVVAEEKLLEKKSEALTVTPVSKVCEVVDLSDVDVKPKVPTISKPVPPPPVVVEEPKRTEPERPRIKVKDERQLYSDFTNNCQKVSSTPISTMSQPPPPVNVKMTDHSIKRLSAPTNYSSLSMDYSQKQKPADDIQKVMEDLKALQKLSSPNKIEPQGSQVSVIAYNQKGINTNAATSSSIPSPKNMSHPSISQPLPNSSFRTPSDYTKSEFGTGFQEAFQRQIMNELNYMKNAATAAGTSSTKNHYSTDKYGHPTGAAGFTNDKFFQAANNNFAMQNAAKHLPTPPTTGSYIFDDMLSNFFNEYGYPKTANHKPKAPQK